MEERNWGIERVGDNFWLSWNMFYRAIHSAMARIMDGDKQQYNDALIAAQALNARRRDRGVW